MQIWRPVLKHNSWSGGAEIRSSKYFSHGTEGQLLCLFSVPVVAHWILAPLWLTCLLPLSMPQRTSLNPWIPGTKADTKSESSFGWGNQTLTGSAGSGGGLDTGAQAAPAAMLWEGLCRMK